ncbi:MAG TPA: VWA domain-containing protein [Polyangiales bacterium]
MSGRQLLWTAITVLLVTVAFVGGVVVNAAPARQVRRRAPENTVLQPAVKPTPGRAAGPEDPVHMTVRLDRSAVQSGSDGQLHVELALRADQVAASTARAPTDFVIVLDRSGSMQGEKLAFAKTAAERLVELLLPSDRLALITYDDQAESLLPLAQVTDAARVLRLIRGIADGGSTNLSAGLEQAIDALSTPSEPERMRRVLLLSDGLANQGDTSPRGLAQRAARIVEHGAVLSTMGIGDDFDQDVMTALSEAGSGNFYYLAKLDALPEFFQSEFKASSMTVASNLTVEFVPGAYVQVLDASGYTLERRAGVTRFSPGTLSSGQQRSLWLTLSVPTSRVADFELGTVKLSYLHDGQAIAIASTLQPRVRCVEDAAVARAAIERDVWERAVRDEEYGKYQRALSELVKSGSAADVDRVAADYARKNQQLAAELGSSKILDNVGEAQRAAADAKHAQAQSSSQREVSSKRMKAGAIFKRRADAYLSDPSRGLW